MNLCIVFIKTNETKVLSQTTIKFETKSQIVVFTSSGLFHLETKYSHNVAEDIYGIPWQRISLFHTSIYGLSLNLPSK